jgi:hypothetical protein
VKKIFLKGIVVGAASLVASLAATGAAAAEVPAWCKDASVEAPSLQDLSSSDVSTVIKTFVGAQCAPTAETESHRAEIERARQAWSKRLGMSEADWADAAQYASPHSGAEATVASKTLATASPLDQYAIIAGAGSRNSSSRFDAMYAADMFDAKLSEVGRYGFLKTTCFDAAMSTARDPDGLNGAEATWAICQPDFDRFDLAKFYSELRSDTSHSGVVKMRLRIEAYEFPKLIKEHAADVAKALAHDDATKKLFEIAAKARTEWTSTAGRHTQLLELVLAMESATLAESRKQLEGCGEKTEAALIEAVAEIPAKEFAGLHDDRSDPHNGVATGAAVVLMRSPTVGLAAIALTLCDPRSPTAGLLLNMLHYAPGIRGPRNAAIGKIASAKITYDNLKAKLTLVSAKPYGDRYPDGTFSAASAGGVVKSVKREGDKLTVTVENTATKVANECIKSHRTNRVSSIRPDGSVVYEQHCDKSGTVVHDNTWAPFKVRAKFAPWLTPGVLFSASDEDVIAVWPNKTAKNPSIVLGAKLR